MSDQQRAGDSEYIAQRRWELLAGVAIRIALGAHLLVEAIRAQIRVCPPALCEKIQNTVRRQADEPVQEPRTSRREPSGSPSAASAAIAVDPEGFAG